MKEVLAEQVENAANAEEVAAEGKAAVAKRKGVDPARERGRAVRYAVAGGRILTWSLETHLVDHCNLRCRECCTISPFLPPWSVDPTDLEDDLRRAAEVLRPSLFKLTGGEPLLHPRLLECVEAVRRSGISPQISLTTNGFLLLKAPRALFRALDRITLSVYSSAPIPERVLARIHDRCDEAGVLLNVKEVSEFQVMTPEEVPQSREAALQTFSSCWMRERCHLLYRGSFYTCTRPPHLASLYDLDVSDGVRLDGPNLLDRVLETLEREASLESCRYCRGTTGPYRTHQQIRGDTDLAGESERENASSGA